jgi:hypothetical protein
VPLLVRVEGEDLALPVLPRHVGEHAQQLPAGGHRDKRRMIQGMDQFSQPGYPKTAVPGKKLPGCRLVGGPPRTDLHGTNVTATGKGVLGPQATFSTSARSHAFPAADEDVHLP